jgi:transcriptional regulator with XRE-family HTH domain
VELAKSLETLPADQRSSALAALRLQRKLTVEQAAKRASLWPDQVEWLEEGRLYRFPSSEAAVLALLRYATSLDVDHREALSLSGLPAGPAPPKPFGRWIAIGVSVFLVAALTAALAFAVGRSGAKSSNAATQLLPPWRMTVDVLNGGGDINFTKQLASRIGSFGYRIERVGRAGRFGYRQTVVYFEPGGEAFARRLADQLGCGSVAPLPGGKNPRRLVVIAGPPSAACSS